MEISSCRRKILVAMDESDEILLWAIENLISPLYSLNGSSPSDHIVLLHVQPSAQILASDLEENNGIYITRLVFSRSFPSIAVFLRRYYL